MRSLLLPAGPPNTATEPAARSLRPSSTFSSVDLPAPLGPRIATNSPSPTSRSTSLQIVRPPSATAPLTISTAATIGLVPRRLVQRLLKAFELGDLPLLEAL
jgi:hypothetical protein